MELWKNIKGYEDKYMISNLGRVKSLVDNKKRLREHIKTPRKAKNGYLYVLLWKNSISETKKIHRLVAEHFIDNAFCLPQVNHKDGNKENNRVDNLEWCTAKHNVHHAIINGLFNTEKTFFKKGKDNPRYGKIGINSKPIIQLDLFGNVIKEWETIKMAQETLKVCHISDCCKEKRKTAGGYKWKYKYQN